MNQKPELGSWKGGLGRRSGSELRDYGFLAKSWYKNDWMDLAFSRVKVCESHHLENTFKHLLYLSFPQSRSLIDSFLSLPTVTLLVSAIICLSSGFLQSHLSPFFQSCFSLYILALLCRRVVFLKLKSGRASRPTSCFLGFPFSQGKAQTP